MQCIIIPLPSHLSVRFFIRLCLFLLYSFRVALIPSPPLHFTLLLFFHTPLLLFLSLFTSSFTPLSFCSLHSPPLPFHHFLHSSSLHSPPLPFHRFLHSSPLLFPLLSSSSFTLHSSFTVTPISPRAFNMTLLSILILAGMVRISLYPFEAAAIARPIPVLPDVGSTSIVLP